MSDPGKQPAREEIFARLNSETASVAWHEIERFFASGQLWRVAGDEDLVAVATGIAMDDKAGIQDLLAENRLVKVDSGFVQSECQPATEFWCVVVAPFVLIQKKAG